MNAYFVPFQKFSFQTELSKQYLDSILVLLKLPDSLVSKTQNDIGIYHALVGIMITRFCILLKRIILNHLIISNQKPISCVI